MTVRPLQIQDSKKYPWILVAILWCCAFLNNGDRSLLVAVMPAIRDEFHLTNTQLALPTTIFFWVYAIAVFLTSRLGDKMLRSQVILGGLVLWSIATGMVSLSTSFAMLIGMRAMVAIGEAPYYPSATALISDWHPIKTRGRALSLHQTGVFAGALLGSLSAGYMADRMGWRAPFIVFGVLGLLFGVVVFKLLKDAPNRTAELAERKNSEPLKIVLKTKPALYLCLVFFLATAASNGLTVWAPTFVYDKLHTNLADSALVGSVTINAAGMFAVPLGGLLADYLGLRTSLGRFYTLAIGLTIAGLMLLQLFLANSLWGVAIVLLASTLGKGIFDGCIYAAMHDVIPPEARSTAVGVMTMFGFFGAGIAPLFVASMGEVFGMGVAISSLASLYFIAVGILLATRSVTRAAIIHHHPVEVAA
ncbi:MAG: transporter [Massilia sp.]|jgi:MFS family permease|nr:transporter [Massilia sp.]MDB5952528.1 transporter [Massilia sp.]